MKYQGVFPEGRFGTLVVDPPWPGGLRFPEFRKKARDIPTTTVLWKYEQMSLEELKAMAPDIVTHTTDDSHLWLWVVNMFLLKGAAFELCKAWGFTPKALLTWDKVYTGLGRWLRGQTEHCIWATSTRGKGAHLTHKGSDTLPTLIREKKRGHSMKPDAFWRYPETLSPSPRLELFSRSPRLGWTSVQVDLTPEEARISPPIKPPLCSDIAGGVSDAAIDKRPSKADVDEWDGGQLVSPFDAGSK